MMELSASAPVFIYGTIKQYFTFQKASVWIIESPCGIHKPLYTILKIFEFVLKPFSVLHKPSAQLLKKSKLYYLPCGLIIF